MKKILKFTATLLCTLLLLFFLLEKVNLSQVLTELSKAAPGPLIAALAISFISNCFFAAWRWRFILSRLGLRISLREAFLIKMGSGPLKSILPFRSGEASRVLYLKRRYDFSAVISTTSILLELGSNILVFVLFILIGGTLFDTDPSASRLPLILGLFFIVVGGFALVLPPCRRKLKKLVKKIPFPRLRGGLETLFSLRGFFRPYEIIGCLLFSLIIGIAKLFSFYLVVSALGFNYSWETYLVALPFSILISTIPITFLGIGLRENSLAALIPLYNAAIPESIIVGSALLLTGVEYLFPALLGLFWVRPFVENMVKDESKPRLKKRNHETRHKRQN